VDQSAITNKIEEELIKISGRDFSKIKKIISNLTAFFKLKMIGPDAVRPTEWASLVADNWVNPADPIDAMKTIPGIYIRTISMLPLPPPPESIRNRTIKFLKTNSLNYLEGLRQKLTNDAHAIILGEGAASEKMRSILGEGVEAGASNQEIAQKLSEAFGRFNANWQSVVRTELAHAQNIASFDAIISNNEGKNPEEILVAKYGPWDAKTCKSCQKLWHWEENPLIPKIYKLSELQANNIGRKAADAVASIAPTHPHCRHVLVQVPVGYGFDNEGNLTYKGSSYSELDRQRKK
jgi:hypothetical protein